VISPSQVSRSPARPFYRVYRDKVDDDDAQHEGDAQHDGDAQHEVAVSRVAVRRMEPWWTMPELLDIEFGQEVWKAKSREYSIERLFDILRADPEADSENASELV
jgi:hypothetical protein